MTESPIKQPKFRRRAEDRPDEVLDAALILFTEQGFARTTVEQVARKAGLSKGTVYLYFNCKEALLEGLVRRTLDPIAGAGLEMMKAYRGDPLPVLRMFLRQVAQVLNAPKARAVPLIILHEAPARPDIAQLFRSAVLDRALPAIRGLLAQGIKGGHIRPVDPDLTARTIMGPIIVHLLLSEIFDLKPEGGLQMDALVENHLSIVTQGLKTDGSGAS